jgi:exopolyphosphatase/guanosine-5'-triphosphate,3'-diphosphate pyrophosphatase
MSKAPKVAAVIDIGSNALRLKIAEYKQGEIKILDYLRYPLSLGRDCFSIGKITFETVDKTCEIIEGFLNIIKEYDVDEVKAVATTAVREAQNKEYIIDQIKLKTGLDVVVLDDAEEKVYIYKDMCRSIEKHERFNSQGPMVYIGSGSLGFAMYDKGTITFTQTIKAGSLKVSEILGKIQDRTEKFYIVVEEYLRGFTSPLKNIIPTIDSKYFFASGREMEMIATLCEAQVEGDFWYISKKKFQKLYDVVKLKTPEQLMELYDIKEEKAEVLLTSMAIYKQFLEFTQAEIVMAPLLFLTDALLYEMLCNKDAEKYNELFVESTILSARNLGRRYQSISDHEANVERYALKIFDKMKKIHGLGERERLYLQVAAILHDVGKFINLKHHYENSYNIIKNSDIFGLTAVETDIVANLARYHSNEIPSIEHEGYSKFRPSERIIIGKLTAILRIADSLDCGYEKKFDDIDVKIKEKHLIISFSTYKDTVMEEWAFERKSELFEDVYGMKACINKKKVI